MFAQDLFVEVFDRTSFSHCHLIREFFFNFKGELQTHWSWQASMAAGWLPPNVTSMPLAMLNVCQAGDPDELAPAASSDLPWYNVLPTRSGSPFLMLMVIGLGTLVSVAVLLSTSGGATRSAAGPRGAGWRATMRSATA